MYCSNLEPRWAVLGGLCCAGSLHSTNPAMFSSLTWSGTHHRPLWDAVLWHVTGCVSRCCEQTLLSCLHLVLIQNLTLCCLQVSLPVLDAADTAHLSTELQQELFQKATESTALLYWSIRAGNVARVRAFLEAGSAWVLKIMIVFDSALETRGPVDDETTASLIRLLLEHGAKIGPADGHVGLRRALKQGLVATARALVDGEVHNWMRCADACLAGLPCWSFCAFLCCLLCEHGCGATLLSCSLTTCC